MNRFTVGRAIATGLIVATMGAALATPVTAQADGLSSMAPAPQQSAIADDAAGPLLLYSSLLGTAETIRILDKGVFLGLRSVGPFDRGWTQVVSVGAGRVVIYRASDGLTVTGTVNTDGVFTALQEQFLARGWSHITKAGDARLLFYSASDGLAQTAEVDLVSGLVRALDVARTFDPSWTHITYVGDRRLLFYRSGTGNFAAGVVNTDGTFTNLWFRPGLFVGLTQVAYAGRGQILMYRRTDGRAQTALVGTDNLLRRITVGGFDTNWNIITYAGDGRVVSYKSSTGVATSGQVDGSGGYQNLVSVNVPTSLSHITTPLI